MRPLEREATPEGNYLVQPKLNGVFARWDSKSQRLFSKTGVAFEDYIVPHVYAALRGYSSTDFDGELWSPTMTLNQIAGAVSHENRNPAVGINFWPFDIANMFAGFAVRHKHLCEIYNLAHVVPLLDADHVESMDPNDCRYDGTVHKFAKGLYVPGESANCIKVKFYKDIDCVVVGVEQGTPGKTFTEGLGALRCLTPWGKEFSVGAGFTIDQRYTFIDNPPAAVKVKYLNLSPYKTPLNPVFLGVTEL